MLPALAIRGSILVAPACTCIAVEATELDVFATVKVNGSITIEEGCGCGLELFEVTLGVGLFGGLLGGSSVGGSVDCGGGSSGGGDTQEPSIRTVDSVHESQLSALVQETQLTGQLSQVESLL